MPFAPFVLEEDAERVFEITDVNRYAARFMTITCARAAGMARRGFRRWCMSTAPRGRRSCASRSNPLFAAILRGFRDATGLPVLINTSFNVHEEPIVNRPEECLQALRDERIDFVVTNRAVYAAPNVAPPGED